MIGHLPGKWSSLLPDTVRLIRLLAADSGRIPAEEPVSRVSAGPPQGGSTRVFFTPPLLCCSQLPRWGLKRRRRRRRKGRGRGRGGSGASGRLSPGAMHGGCLEMLPGSPERMRRFQPTDGPQHRGDPAADPQLHGAATP